jgi:putative oxidoreductase
LIGAFFLALGFLTRLNAVALLLVMLVAIYFHLLHDGFKVAPLETASLYALCFLFFTLNGGGRFSIDTLIVKWLTKNVEHSN